jgi:hypothetical protein
MSQRFVKDALWPGKYRLVDGREVEYTPEQVRHLGRRLKDMVKAGLQVPLAYEHQDVAKPMSAEQLSQYRAEKVKLTAGYATGCSLDQNGYLQTEVEADSDEDARNIKKIKFVSPEITRDFIDGTGKKWPGLSITHLALTNRPVQHKQQPFRPLPQRMSFGEVVRLSLEDLSEAKMADDNSMGEDKGSEMEDKDAVPNLPAGGADEDGKEADFDELKELLMSHGITLPEDTDSKNLIEHLKVALTALQGRLSPKGGETETQMGGPPGSPTPQEAPGTPAYMMSLEKRFEAEKKAHGVTQGKLAASQKKGETLEKKLVEQERLSLEGRITGLVESGIIPVHLAAKLKGDLKTVRMSLGDDGACQPSDVALKVAAYEDLKGHDNLIARLSHTSVGNSGGEQPREVDPPDVASEKERQQLVNRLTTNHAPRSRNGKKS